MKQVLPTTLLAATLLFPGVGVRFSATLEACTTATPANAPSPTPPDSDGAPSPATQQQPPKPADAAPKKRKLDADLSGFDVSDNKSDKKVSTMLGGSRSAAVPSATLLAPHRAKFLGASADFSWTFSGHNEGYILLITDEDETQILRVPTKDPRYTFDPAKTKLTDGDTYYWRVQVLPNTLASDPLEFTVVTADERAAIEKQLAAVPAGDPYDAALTRARILVDHRLWFDSLGAYSALIAKYPNHPELYEDRSTIYAQLPATKAQSDADKSHAK
jgi:Domain of Unknown Function (DUF928)